MAANSDDVRLHIDSDWKSEAAKEKERLAEQEKAQAAAKASGAAPAVNFLELLNLLVMQAAVALQGMVGPGGERIPPNPASARYFIDMLEMLEQKTRGNLSEEEKRAIEGVLYEIRMQYVHSVSPHPKPAP